MKKFAICCLALVAVAMLVPTAQAKPGPVTTCIVLTNFCDGIQIVTSKVGGIQAKEVVGLWDYVCAKNGTGSLMAGSVGKFGTHPTYPFDGGFSANFTLKAPALLFDLYGTFDGLTAFAFQTNQPYTPVAGPCSPLAPRNPGRSATGR
jgi:hypothetical protein